MDIKGVLVSAVLVVAAAGGTAIYFTNKEKNSVDRDEFEPVSVERSDEDTAEEEAAPEIIANELDTNSFRFYDVSKFLFTDIKPETAQGFQ